MSDFAVTVVIPLYNKRAFIRRTLQSALDQSRPADEIIIVDDQSTDGSVEEIADLIGGAVRLVSQPKAGPGIARNRGIEEATKEWIVFLDADDLWQPNHLATLAEVAAARPGAEVVASGHRRLLPGQSLPDEDHSALNPASIDLLAGPSEALCSSSVAVRHEALVAAGGFDARFPGEDIDLWLRLALAHTIAATPRQTSLYVQQTGGLMDRLGDDRAIVNEQPIFESIARSLADPRHARHHAALRILRNRHLDNAIKQALYRGQSGEARGLIAECDRLGAAIHPGHRLLARLPAAALAAALRARSGLRR